ncbi:MAG: alpha/beta fold hydrolase [Segniliparus sp.]|uniref:alpha/beta fold hydrolase n=1 Tax=Segniliparus sp. TaxID=2804064 RepID=UPI003F39AF29
MERTIQKKLPVGQGSWVVVDVYGDPAAAGIVVFPGVMSDANTWRAVAAGVAAWPSVAVVNRRGRAPSGPLTSEYSLQREVEDLGVVLDELGGWDTVFGWSYGALAVLLAANCRPLGHVIAYEPVLGPFAADALAGLKAADEQKDWDRSVEIVNRQVSGFSEAHVEALRADHEVWAGLRSLAEPLHAELDALNTAPVPQALGLRAGRVDLVVGGRNRGTAPYGTAFDDVRRRTPEAKVHEFPGQGHLAHVEDPGGLSRLIDALAPRTGGR